MRKKILLYSFIMIQQLPPASYSHFDSIKDLDRFGLFVNTWNTNLNPFYGCF